ncbi:MAG: polysaccharide biosynthesis protein [Clostridia bacterium]|nr:polysaccharide biosynthesis protein [Clostridia bacterium]
MNRLKRFAANAAIMGGVTIFMRIISVTFGAYTANTVGAQGIGIHSLIMSAYVFAVTVANSGISLAVTRLVSEELGKGNTKAAIAAMRKCVMYSIIFGSAAALALFTFARPIGVHLLGDERTVISLKALSVSLPFIALSNVLSGYFNAVRRVSKSAAAAITEQFVKIAITVALLHVFGTQSVEYSCLALVLGTSISEGLSFIYLLFFYLRDKRKYLRPKEGEQVPRGLTARMLHISLPIAASAYLRSGLVTLEHILIPYGLRRSGKNQAEALASYGTVHGMVLPLVLFPSAVSSTFASLIIPELSELAAKYERRDTKHIKYIVCRAITFCLIFGMACAGAFIVFAKPLGMLVYKSEEAAKYIGVFAVLVPLMYLDTVVDGMLKGLGEQLASMKYNIIDAAISVFLVYTLLPRMGINGYIVCVFITELVNDVLSLSRLISVTGVKIPVYRTVIAPLISVIGAGAAAHLVMRALPFAFHHLAVETVCGILILLVFYINFLVIFRAISKDDVNWLFGIFRRKETA